jgi:hypothetical protein
MCLSITIYVVSNLLVYLNDALFHIIISKSSTLILKGFIDMKMKTIGNLYVNEYMLPETISAI